MLACSVSFLNGPGYDWHDLLTEWTALLTWHYSLSRSFAKSFKSGLISGGRSTQPLASQNPYHIVVCSMANYESHLSHLWINERGNFWSGIFPFFNPNGIFLPPQNPEKVRPHSRNSIENRTLIWSIQAWECGPIHRDIPISLWLRSPPLPTIPRLRIPLKPS